MGKGISIVLLCGGLSSRYGREKVFIKRPNGEALLYTLLSEIAERYPVFLSLNKEQVERGILHEYNLPVIVDRYQNIGPIGGLASSMEQLPGQPILLLACDMPNVRLSAIDHLVDAFEEDGTTSLISSTADSQIEPLFSIYHSSLKDRVQAAIDEKQYGLQHLIKTIPHQRYTISASITANINTPSDYQKYMLRSCENRSDNL